MCGGEKNTKPQEQLSRETSTTPRNSAEDQQINQVLVDTEQYLQDSRRLRKIAALKVSGTTLTGRINPAEISKKHLTNSRRVSKADRTGKEESLFKTEGIDISKLQRRKAAGECLHCAWPSDRKGSHRVKNCRRPIKLDKGTAGFAKKGEYQKSIESSGESSSAKDSDSQDNIN